MSRISILSLLTAAMLLSAAPSDALADTAANPDDRKVGIGTGYILPNDLDTTNTVSVRFRFGQLTLEPRVDFSYTKITDDLGGNTDDTSLTTLAVGTVGRLVLAESRGIELVGLGSVGVAFTSNNPDGDDNRNNVTTFSANWGIGLDYWVSSRWVLSMSALNPLISHRRDTQQTPADDLTDTQTSIGVVFDPTVIGMVHLFF